MKQADRREMEMLLEILRVGGDRPPSPWKHQHRPDMGKPHSPTARDGSYPSLAGIERRLVRRAHTLWDELRGMHAMPHAAQSAPLLAAPFANHAVLILYPGPDRATIAHVGEQVRALGVIAAGKVRPDIGPNASLAARFAALGHQAITNAAPARLHSEDMPPDTAAAPPLLMRNLALPIHTGSATAAAIIITSWRKLLSADETAALHREMEAAMDWISRPARPPAAPDGKG